MCSLPIVRIFTATYSYLERSIFYRWAHALKVFLVRFVDLNTSSMQETLILLNTGRLNHFRLVLTQFKISHDFFPPRTMLSPMHYIKVMHVGFGPFYCVNSAAGYAAVPPGVMCTLGECTKKYKSALYTSWVIALFVLLLRLHSNLSYWLHLFIFIYWFMFACFFVFIFLFNIS